MQHGVGIARRSGDAREDGFEQRAQVGGGILEGQLGHAGAGVGVNHREIEQVLGGVQVDEEIVDLVEDFLDARVRPVDLVDHQHRRQIGFQGLHEHVAGLGQRALARVHQEHDAIHELERALHFAAEIAVPRRVHDVDLDAAIAHAGVLRENGDAALALQVHGIEHLFMHFALREGAGQFEQAIGKRRFAVVNVRDDAEISYELWVHSLPLPPGLCLMVFP